MHPLDGPRARIKRARADTVCLQNDFRATFEKQPYRVVEAELNAKRGVHVLRAQGGPGSLPMDWGVTIGNVAHNLRAALDGLAFQLARLQCAEPSTSTEFPIFLHGHTIRRHPGGNLIGHFWDGKNGLPDRDIQEISQKYWTRLESFQPYKAGNGNRTSPLFRLHELNNADKHRLITVVNPTVGALHWSGVSGGTKLYVGVTLRPNVKVGHIFPLPPGKGVHRVNLGTGRVEYQQTQVTDKLDISTGVRFGNTCKAVERLSVISTLERMADEVARIIESFATEF